MGFFSLLTRSNQASRTAAKLVRGENITVTFLGDSILEGLTATTPGTDDAASLVCSDLATRFGVTVTKSNRAVSGWSTWRALVSAFDAAIDTDAADLLVIAFGHNDLRSDIDTPGTGYPRTQMAAAIEHMFRRWRDNRPEADIILMLEQPYGTGATSSNTYLEQQNALLEPLATAYRVWLADGYQAFMDVGDYNSLLADAGHPNSDGHRLLADTILAFLPATPPYALRQVPSVPTVQHTEASRYGDGGWEEVTTAAALAGTFAVVDGKAVNRYNFVGSGWASGVSSTAGDSVACRVAGPEFALFLDCGSGTGVVDIFVDGVLLYNDLDLTAYTAGQRRIPIVGLEAGPHDVSVVIVSGTITFRGVAVLQGNTEEVQANDARFTYVGSSWATYANTSSAVLGGHRVANTAGDYVELTFTGTGIVAEMTSSTSGAVLVVNVTVDDVALDSVQYSQQDTGGFAAFVLANGLEFSEHTIRMTLDVSSSNAFAGMSILGATEAP